jgi:hypothetical protein
MFAANDRTLVPQYATSHCCTTGHHGDLAQVPPLISMQGRLITVIMSKVLVKLLVVSQPQQRELASSVFRKPLSLQRPSGAAPTDS